MTSKGLIDSRAFMYLSRGTFTSIGQSKFLPSLSRVPAVVRQSFPLFIFCLFSVYPMRIYANQSRPVIVRNL